MGRVTKLLAVLILVFGTMAALPATATAAPQRPIIFVHGFFGSGSQFETQARRFTSNGYPAGSIDTYEYDSTFASSSRAEVITGLDARIDRLLASTGSDKVELLGHSLGTSLSQEYLNSSAARAAKVAHYVNIDGAAATSLPGGVPTLAIWGEGNQRTITGATNVNLPDESHVQTATSVPTFTAAYTFFTGQAPTTTEVVPQSGSIQLSGRALNFPANSGVAGARLDVFRVNPATGRRTSQTPVATYQLTGDGSFGPFNGSGTDSYEFAITKGNDVHHQYFPPFRRTDHLIRLLTNEAGTGADLLIRKGPNHSAVLSYRNKEWWGDQGAGSDTLSLNGTNVLNSTTAPRSKRAIAVFAFDARADRVSHPTDSLGSFAVLPFMTGVDLYVPASPLALGSVQVETKQRGGTATTRFAIPNWPSDRHRVTLYFDDYLPSA